MRRRRPESRKTLPDPKYGSMVASRFINGLMWDGEKSLAMKIFYEALNLITERTKEEGIKVFEKAVENVKPRVEVRPRRIGGATYQVPMEVSPKRQLSLSVRWIIKSARGRSEKTIVEKLAGEFIEASQNTGRSIKIRENTHKMAEANKAFAHYRW